MATYKRLTLAQRYLIQTLHQQGHTQQQIAQQVGVSQATISRELARNDHHQAHKPYKAEQAQKRATMAQTRTPYKLKGDLRTLVISRLRDRLSPEQICGELARGSTKKRLHHETIYGSGRPSIYLPRPEDN